MLLSIKKILLNKEWVLYFLDNKIRMLFDVENRVVKVKERLFKIYMELWLLNEWSLYIFLLMIYGNIDLL